MKITAAILATLVAIPLFGDNEITVNLSVKLVKGVISQNQQSGDLAYDLRAASAAYNGSLVSVSNGLTAIPVGNVTSNGYLWFKNVDTNEWVTSGITNAGGKWVEVCSTNGQGGRVVMGKVFSKEVGCFPLHPDAVLYFFACTNNVNVQTFLITR